MPLKPLVIEKGIILPSFGNVKRNRFFRFDIITAGVLTDSGLPVNQSKTTMNEKTKVVPTSINPTKTEINHVDADAIYFAVPEKHFGHCLTGAMAYAYILLDNDYKNHKIAFAAFPPAYTELYEPTKILLKHLGVKEENIMVINKHTQFRSVTVLKPSLRLIRISRFRKRLYAINNEFIDTFRPISEKFIDEKYPEKVFFSRRKIPYGQLMFADKIEQVFENNGYKIIFPEYLPLDEQIKLVANSDYFVCFQGTLEHFSVFLKDGATFITMNRRNKQTARQVLINKLQAKIKQIHLRTVLQPIGDRISPNIVGATKDFIKFLDEYGFTYDEECLNITNQEINDYLDKITWRSVPLPRFVFKRFLKFYILNKLYKKAKPCS